MEKVKLLSFVLVFLILSFGKDIISPLVSLFLMYNSFLSYSMVTHYLKLLTVNGSLEYDEPNKAYRITEAGLRVLELHNKIIGMLKV